jgi:hypothetical protein
LTTNQLNSPTSEKKIDRREIEGFSLLIIDYQSTGSLKQGKHKEDNQHY